MSNDSVDYILIALNGAIMVFGYALGIHTIIVDLL
jgi:hypothetical protein